MLLIKKKSLSEICKFRTRFSLHRILFLLLTLHCIRTGVSNGAEINYVMEARVVKQAAPVEITKNAHVVCQ